MANPKLVDFDGNKGLKFLVEEQGDSHWVLLSREMLDDEVGDDATKIDRIAWAEKNMVEIMKAYEAKKSGGIIRKPFDRIAVKGKS